MISQKHHLDNIKPVQKKIQFSTEILNTQNIPEKYECPVCLQLLCQPVFCKNAHNICTSCFSNLRNKKCPVCRANYEDPDIKYITNQQIVKDIKDNFTFKCPNYINQCPQILSCDLTEFQKHIKSCKFQYYKCPNNGCNLKVMKKDLEYHCSNICEFSLYQCQFCVKNNNTNKQSPYLKRKDQETHILDCRYRPLKCQYCKKEVTQEKLESHEEECIQKIYDCILCKEKYSIKDASFHESFQCSKNTEKLGPVLILMKQQQDLHNQSILKLQDDFKAMHKHYQKINYQKDQEIQGLRLQVNILEEKVEKQVQAQIKTQQNENQAFYTPGSKGIFINTNIKQLLSEGFNYVYIESYSHSTNQKLLENIGKQCNKDNLICVAVIDQVLNDKEFKLCCIDSAQEALIQTFSYQKANRTKCGNFFYNVDGSSFGFSKTQDIQLIQATDTACEQDEFRLSWSLNGEGGARIGSLRNVFDQRYKKIILVK